METKSTALRQRRSHLADDSPSEEADEDEKESLQPTLVVAGGSRPLSFQLAFVALLISRCLSARHNIIHDCDETFNYWEPLHHILYGTGLQTWEYSAAFGLRSYLYLLLHALVAGPASFFLNKLQVFYLLRTVLGGLSAGSEACLVAAAGKVGGKRVGAYTLLLLCFSTGCFTASTAFLPSTFSMYGLTLAAALWLEGRPGGSVGVAAAGVLLGWPFSVLATAPLVLHALLFGGFKMVFGMGAAVSLGVLIPSILADRFFYGRWTCSILNLVLYNALGGGDSTLYGTEDSSFYFRNAANNFNLALPLAMVLCAVMLAVRKAWYPRLALATAPLYVWMGFMSLQPHKEERFLFIVYPILCLAAAASLEGLPDLLPEPMRGPKSAPTIVYKVANSLRTLILIVFLLLSYWRTSALLTYYEAPMDVYKHLPEEGGKSVTRVCVGSEWHRFPSSFFLPSSNHHVAFLDDGFRGLLPFAFNTSLGGSASAPLYFNKENKASKEQFVSEDSCEFLVELDLRREGVTPRGSDGRAWKMVVQKPFLDSESTPSFYRALLIPGLSEKHLVQGTYSLYKRVDQKRE